MESSDMVVLLTALLNRPEMSSFVEEQYLDILIDAGLYSTVSGITAKGRDFLAMTPYPTDVYGNTL